MKGHLAGIKSNADSAAYDAGSAPGSHKRNLFYVFTIIIRSPSGFRVILSVALFARLRTSAQIYGEA